MNNIYEIIEDPANLIQATTSVDGTTGIAITNTNELYNYLGAEQVYTLYDLIKELVEDQ